MRYVMQVQGHLDPFWQAWFENLVITREGRPRMYVSIRIQGHLDPSWQEWLEGLQIAHEADGTSRLFGPLQEQSALHGVLATIGRLHLTLLSLESRELSQTEGG
jgi:hypothetical protein